MARQLCCYWIVISCFYCGACGEEPTVGSTPADGGRPRALETPDDARMDSDDGDEGDGGKNRKPITAQSLESSCALPDGILPTSGLWFEALIDQNAVVKFPSVFASNCEISMVSRNVTDSSGISLWTKPIGQNAGAAVKVQSWPSTGKEDYSTGSIASGPDGTTYTTWTSLIGKNASQVWFTSRPAKGDWTTSMKLHEGEFCPQVDVAVAGDAPGTVVVLWKSSFGGDSVRYKTSTDGGATWAEVQTLSSVKSYSMPRLSRGQNGQVTLITSSEGNLAMYLFDGTSFSQKIPPPPMPKDTSRFSPNMMTDSEGGMHISYRQFSDQSGQAGVYYGYLKTSDSTWSIHQLTGNNAFDTVGLAVDGSDRVHIAWFGNDNKVHYRIKAADSEVPSGGVDVAQPPNTGLLANPDVAIYPSNPPLLLMIGEYWRGDEKPKPYLWVFSP